MAYIVVKVPLSILAILFAISLWWDAFRCLTYPFWAVANRGGSAEWGAIRVVYRPTYLTSGSGGALVGFATVITGVFFLLLAPWPVRFFVYIDRLLMHALLSPDSVTVRLRTLERTRAQTVDASAAILRRIERDLHDGTQAQLVALAMRLGLAKEKLADPEHVDLDQVRDLVSDAHKGAKEAIVELRDLARGIHPPALDVGTRRRPGDIGGKEHHPDGGHCRHRRTAQPGDRGDRLLLRGRAHGQRRPARVGVEGQHLLCPAGSVAAARGA